ncbi:MAG: extracellular solute-binding protein [Oscillospiraceae bacterium]|nr:extracellular solute-binding protein [Oscillospiraceae bacterium]
MKRKLAIFLAALILFTCASACGGGGDGSSLTVWCAEMDKEMITAMAEAFLADNSGVKEIKVEVCEDDSAQSTLEEDPAAAADVICIPHNQLGPLVNKNRLFEITGENHLADIHENTAPAVKAGQINGKQYGFPSSFETHMLFYDRSVIADADVLTLEGILSNAVTENGYPFVMEFGNAYFSANWFFTYGCKLFGDSGEDSTFCDFNGAGGVAAMTYLIENREKFGNYGGDDAIDLFKEHRLGAFIGGPWNAAAVTEVLKGNYGCAGLPSVDGKPMKSFAGYKLYCVNANTKNKETAMELAAWLTNPDNQKIRFQTRNLIPVAASLADDVDVAVSATAKAIMAQGPNAIAMPAISEMDNFWEPAGNLTLACYNGEIELSELQAKLDELTQEIIGEQ